MQKEVSSFRLFVIKQKRYFTIFFIIFYIVGLAGLLSPDYHNLFLSLFPSALILSISAVLLFHEYPYDLKTIIVLSGIFLGGYLIEVAGVNTHRIFGWYIYGKTLGLKLFETPVLIGINWLFLSYCACSITDSFNTPVWLKIICGSVILVLFDMLLEQVAPTLEMWLWFNTQVPVLNYIAWFIISVLFQATIRLCGIKLKNSFAFFIILIQAIFFMVLTLIIKIPV